MLTETAIRDNLINPNLKPDYIPPLLSPFSYSTDLFI